MNGPLSAAILGGRRLVPDYFCILEVNHAGSTLRQELLEKGPPRVYVCAGACVSAACRSLRNHWLKAQVTLIIG